MRIVSLNLNGIRSAARKGFFDWMLRHGADVYCLQETRAHRHQLDEPVYFPEGYHAHFHDALAKGYSGVAIYSRIKPDEVRAGLGIPEIDAEGRWIEASFGKLRVVSLYLPSGSSGEHRQRVKFSVMKSLMPVLRARKRSRSQHVICGDWNIAHREIDLRNWRSNQKNSGFLPEERAWMDELFAESPAGVGLVDAFRVVDPRPEQYTWWSNRGRAWEKNVGWRIDYQVVSPQLRGLVRSAEIYKDQRFSDHAPLTIEYEV